MTPAEWRRAGHWTTFKQQQVFFRIEGTRTPLLCVHGFPTSSWDWAPIWPALVRDFQVIAPDMLGFGFSGKPADHVYTVGAQADLCHALLRELGIRSVHLLVHDLGNLVAQELLARRREGSFEIEVLSAVGLNATIFPEVYRARTIQKLLASPLGSILSSLIGEKSVTGGLRAVFGPAHPPSPALLADFWSIIREQDGHRRFPRVLNYLNERKRLGGRWADAWMRATMRRRIINGAQDPMVELQMADLYRERVQDADIVLLPGAGHYAHVEDPAGVIRAFQEFHRR